MPKNSDIRIVSARATAEQIAYRTPIKFGGRVVTDVVLLNVEVEVETQDGRRGTGLGSMPMGNAWAWPSNSLTSRQTLDAMLALGQRLVSDAGGSRAVGHPFDITPELSHSHASAAAEVTRGGELAEPMPRLAQLVAASPLEAAIHDAYGKTLGQNSYNLLGPEWVGADLGHYLAVDFAGEYLDRYTLRRPQPRMPLYHLVGALDPLSHADVTKSIGDGLPEILPEWIAADGLTHLKIKLAGDNLAWDVDRVVAVEGAAAPAQRQRGCGDWKYSLDFNEKCANVEYVLDFLRSLKPARPTHFAVCNISNSRRIAICGPIRKTACTPPRGSSR